MPPKQPFNILRRLRLQLKTGYLQNEPDEYKILRRFPPLLNNGSSGHKKLADLNVPYAHLYEKIVNTHPLYMDEKVYPGFAHLEPQALVLAKKQYQLMNRHKLDEKTAFQKAMEYVNELENDSYVKLKKANESIEKHGMIKPFDGNHNVVGELTALQKKLFDSPYHQLPVDEQAEVDYFVQTKVLRWHELERERRMRDPVFVHQFNLLIKKLFPMSPVHEEKEFKQFQHDFKNRFHTLFRVDPNTLQTSQSFYLEDYLHFFDMAKKQPNLDAWKLSDREKLSTWIVDTLAFNGAIVGKDPSSLDRYLNHLRDSFFPMVKFPQLANKFIIPSINEVKRTLMQDEVGYRQDTNNKTFVKRFYRLPALLFPDHIIVLSIAQNTQLRRKAIESEEILHQELVSRGMVIDSTSSLLNEIKSQLQYYDQNTQEQHGFEDDFLQQGNNEKLNIFDRIVNDNAIANGSSTSGDNIYFDDNNNTIAETQKVKEVDLSDIMVDEVDADNDDDSDDTMNKVQHGTKEWKELVNKYVRVPSNDLDKDREVFYRSSMDIRLNDIIDENDAQAYADTRLEGELIVRARLTAAFEKKELARVRKQQALRGYSVEDLPPLPSPLK